MASFKYLQKFCLPFFLDFHICHLHTCQLNEGYPYTWAANIPHFLQPFVWQTVSTATYDYYSDVEFRVYLEKREL